MTCCWNPRYDLKKLLDSNWDMVSCPNAGDSVNDVDENAADW